MFRGELDYSKRRARVSSVRFHYADIIATPGDLRKEITELRRVRFVMKDGKVSADLKTEARP